MENEVTPQTDIAQTPAPETDAQVTTDLIFETARQMAGVPDPTDALTDPSSVTDAAPVAEEKTETAKTPDAPAVAARVAIPGAYLKAAASAGYTAEDFAGMSPADVKDFINSLPKAAFKNEATTDGRKAVSGNDSPNAPTFTLPELPDLLDEDGSIDPKLLEHSKAVKAAFKSALEKVMEQAESKVAEVRQQFSAEQTRRDGEKVLQSFEAEILKDEALKGIVGTGSVYELDQASAEYKNREMLIGQAAALVKAGMPLAKAIKSAAEMVFPDKITAARTALENEKRSVTARAIAQAPRGPQIGGSLRPKSSPAPIPSRVPPSDPFALAAEKMRQNDMNGVSA